MSKDRATTEPGGCECHDCGCIFIGGPWHDICGDCDAARKEAMRQDEQRAEWRAESEMREDQARIALADAMQLHNERLEAAKAEVRRLRAELESAVIRRDQVSAARSHFMRYVEPDCSEA